ncbi:uncharacterized protein zgc:113276 [Electrophorus electricus]|uniref:L-ornithine N(5)-monooxygenase n=1 Tax=Electrophorus electricus TaxID=8005 RepID=A0A4W4EEM1_ELEEL|nr:uncharacterized protein zgc:113276 [Electrophorus electricus]
MLDVLIIGAGPSCLTLATLLSNQHKHMSLSYSDILQGVQLSKRRSKTRQPQRTSPPTGTVLETCKEQECPPCPPVHFRVVDPYGEWASLWESQFRGLNIPHLRSHVLVHTDPLNKKALQEFVVERGRVSELHPLPERTYIQDKDAFFNDKRLGKRDRRRLSSVASLQKSLCFSLPGTQLSMDFFRDQVHRYDLHSVLIKGTVDRIFPFVSKKSKTVEFFRVTLDNGDTIDAKRVVMATGPTRAQMANIPPWVSAIAESYPEEGLRHTVQLMQPSSLSSKTNTGPPSVCCPNQRLMVIGGGLTSAHIISMALQQGASHVTWVLRKHLQLKQFDVGDVESLIGRYSHVEHGIRLDGLAYLRQFYGERSLHRRLAMIKQARKGGAVTPEAYAHLQPFIQAGQVQIRAYCQVTEVKWCYGTQRWTVSLCDGEQWNGERIWLATGCKLDVHQDPLLSDVMKHFPVSVLEGWPCIGESLRWAPGCPLYLMGQYAALQVGPHAVNLAGGQAASVRIARDILDWHSGEEGCPEAVTAQRTRTEQYLSHMHGLMWL